MNCLPTLSAAILAAWSTALMAQSPAVPSPQSSGPSPACIPWTPVTAQSKWVWTEPEMAVTKNGAWIRWRCLSAVPGVADRVVVYVGTVPELAKVGGRVTTILKAADPLRSLQTLPQRITVLPLTDPSLAAILADLPK